MELKEVTLCTINVAGLGYIDPLTYAIFGLIVLLDVIGIISWGEIFRHTWHWRTPLEPRAEKEMRPAYLNLRDQKAAPIGSTVSGIGAARKQVNPRKKKTWGCLGDAAPSRKI